MRRVNLRRSPLCILPQRQIGPMNSGRLVSVVVPTRNSAASLASCLESIRAQTHPTVELVVVDRASSDETKVIARNFGAVVAEQGPERSAQRNEGARLARGEALLFVDSDMILHPEVVERCLEEVPPDAIGVIAEAGLETRFFTRVRGLEKRLYAGNDAVEAARFFPKHAFFEVGGYDEHLTGPEDWDLTDRCRSAGRRIVRVNTTIIHDDSALNLVGLLRKRFWYGRRFVPFLRKSGREGASHLSPHRLAPLLTMAPREPLLCLSFLVLKLLEAIAFGTGIAVGALSRPTEEAVFGRTRRCAAFVEDIAVAGVLDVGCGDGWMARALPELRHYIGMDLRPVAGLPGAAFVRGSALALPFADGSVGAATFFDVLEHLPVGSEASALRELRRVLRPGGALLLSTPNLHPLGTVTDPAWLLRGHRHYREAKVRGLLMDSGFEVERTFVAGRLGEALYLPFFYLVRRLGLRLPFETRWQRRIDQEYQSRGWYTIFAHAVVPISR